MIYELCIRNCALIEEAKINFGEKLNIFTGETGAGKSIIIEALNLCLGGKYDRTFLRKGSEVGEVELILFSDSKNFLSMLKEYDLEIENHESVTVSRKLFSDGKSITKINGKSVRVSDLKRIMASIIDTHGQHQNQALYDKESHIEFLDLYGKSDIDKDLMNYRKSFQEYKEIKNNILKLNDNKSDIEIQREIDLLKFQIEEISLANISEKEYDDLKSKKEIFENGEKIFNSLNEIYYLIHKGEQNAEDLIGKSTSLLSAISSYDRTLKDMEDTSEKIMYDLQDLSTRIRTYIESIDFDPNTLIEIQERLDVINNLRRKYGDSVEDILKYYESISLRLEEIENREELNKKLELMLENTKKELSEKASKLSDARKKVALDFELELMKELKSLNMKNVEFKVNFNLSEYNDIGHDDVEFFISFNLGEELKPINKVASGGEMSRFMLAFKSIISNIDKIETMIFDEIDTGISGRAAQIVGEKLSDISSVKQVLCITHLPQIAAFADTHFYIEKNTDGNRTYTVVEKLDNDLRKKEISRLISGKRITAKTIEHAEEMLELTKNIKR
ncbi:DNA repair protein RecN [Peptostreptococcus faecalis]|uniref:DNA repair protein RecN n=1 Tax=Peptostreptococcus faecalis TaxID=2045015 RepID=UPI000C7DFB04|nr:DNA repair protein RecN [Peptostreptococcus faecalis]